MAQGVMATALVDDFTTTLGYAWPISFKGQGIGSCQAKNNGAKQMSPHVGNFVQDLVEMAKATERLPQLEAELREANRISEEAMRHSQGLEENIISYKQRIEDLISQVRSLEVERDDASFRVLEAEDREHVALNMARSIASAVGNVINTLDPPKPEPVKEPEPVGEPQAPTTPTEGQSDVSPTTEHSLNIGEHAGTTHGSPSVPNAVTSISEVPQGQSESSPTYATMDSTSATRDVHNVPEGQAVSPTDPTHGPYFGKRYRDVSGYVNFHDWLEGGGTEADYYSSRSPY